MQKRKRLVPYVMIISGVLVVMWSVWLWFTAEAMNDRLFLYAPLFCWYAVIAIIWGVIDLRKKPGQYRYK